MKRFALALTLLWTTACLATVPTDTSRLTPIYACDGSDTTFTWTFGLTDDDDLQVILITNATGAETPLTKTTHYSLASANTNDPQDWSSGGTVTTVATYSSDYSIMLRGNVGRTQATNLDDEDLEDALDKLTWITADIYEVLSRCLKIQPSESGDTVQFGYDGTAGYAYRAANGNWSTATPSAVDQAIVSPWDDVLAGTQDDADRRSAKGELQLDHAYDVRDYGADDTGATDSTAAFVAAFDAAEAAGGGVVYLPDGNYLIDGDGTTQTFTLSDDVTVLGGADTTITMTDTLVFNATAADATLVLQADVSRGGNSITVDDADSVSEGDVVYFYTTVDIGPGTKREMQVVKAVDTATEVITFYNTLNLSYATDVDGGSADAGLAIAAYTGKSLGVRNIKFSGTAKQVQFNYFNGLDLENVHWINSSTGTTCLLRAANVSGNHLTIEGGQYGIEVATCRGVVLSHVFATNVDLHPITPNYGSAGVYINDLVSRNCGSSIDSHFAFDVGYDGVDANDTGQLNFRAWGTSYLRNAKQYCTDSGDGVAQYVGGYTAITNGDAADIYADTVMTWDNVQLDWPNIDGTDQDDYLDFRRGSKLILNNVTAKHVWIYSYTTYNGFQDVQIANCRLGQLRLGSGNRVALSNNIFTSVVSGEDDADYALYTNALDKFTVVNNQFTDYNSVCYANASAVPHVWTGCYFEDCNNFLDRRTAAEKAATSHFGNCVFEDMPRLYATAGTVTYDGACKFMGTTDGFSTASIVKTICKTIDLDDDASTDDYQFDDDAANTTEQVITLTNLLPAYAELVSCQLRCFETVTGSAAMSIDVGTTSGGDEILAAANTDSANEINTTAAAGSPVLAATNAARSVYVNATPAANWNTLDAGRWIIFVTYIDYAAIYTQRSP